ncbi:MAG: C25 family cysteine peptidase [Bacteroidales bacterium]|nr:C25 family cysteine peptidase [Bacteroidales bacterium]
MKKKRFKKLLFGWALMSMMLVSFSSMSQGQNLVFGDALASSNSISLVSDSPGKTVLQFSLSQMDLVQVQTEKFGSMSVAVSGDAPQLMRKGSPDLFYFNGSVIIPDFGTSEITIDAGEYVEYTDVDIAPSKGVLTRNVNPMDIPYQKGILYEEDAFFPGDLAKLREPYILRDYRGQVVDVYPLQYNPVTRTLRVYPNIMVSIVATQTKGINERIDRRANTEVLTEFHQIYSRNFLNYASSAKYNPIDEEGLMLVVAHADYMESVARLVNWKNQKGQPTKLVSYAEAGGSATSLKAYITQQYNSEEGLAFVLLVGDAQHIPPMNKTGDSDAAYGHIVGTDSYAEAFVGRFSGETVKHIEDQVAKTIAYERDLTVADTWLKTGLGVASSEGNNPSDIQHMNSIRDKLLGYTYDNVHKVYDPGASAATVVSNLNTGLGIGNYVGHGSTTSWITSGFGLSNMSNLTNVNKLPFIISVACVNGDFVGKTCFAEGFMRASTSEGPTGSIAIFASTVNQSWESPMTGQNEMIDILTESYTNNIKRTYGGIAINGCMKMNDVHGNDGYRMTDTWVIFGDPSLAVRTNTPSQMEVSHNSTLFIGSSFFRVTCDTEGALVAISHTGDMGETELLGTAIVEGGNATVLFDGPLVVLNNLTVTVTDYNRVTYVGSVSAVPADEPYVILKSFQTATSPDYGETVSLDVVLENISEAPYTASAVTATITTECPYVTITDGNVTAGTIIPEQMLALDNAFSFSIGSDIPDQYPMVFTITIAGEYGSESYIWEQIFIVKANAPVLEYGILTIDDTANGNANEALDPGETADVLIVLRNAGHADISDIEVVFTTANPGLIITGGTIPVSQLAAGESTSLEFTLTLADDVPLGMPMILTLTVTGGYSSVNIYELIVGLIPEYCESGANYPGSSHLTKFMFGSLENTTGMGGTYDDFTGDTELVHEFMLGFTYDVSVTLVSEGTLRSKGAKVFVDWNYNGDFTDEGENAFTVRPRVANWTEEGTITIPTDASLGQRFVRVVAVETNNLNNIKPCGSYSYGGTEDYRIILVSPEAPIADFTATPLETMESDVVVFTDQSDNSPMGWNWMITPGVEGVEWDYVEETNSTSRHPLVQFHAHGVYSVILEVTNPEGSNTKIKEDYITINELTEVPDAFFTVSSNEIFFGESINLIDASTNMPTSWDWTISPGEEGIDWEFVSETNAGSRNPEIKFSTTGSYSITLVAANNIGSSDPYTLEDAVNVLEVYLMHSGTISTCSGTFYDSGGPCGQYDYNENYTLTLYPSVEGNMMSVTFTELNIEGPYDKLRVYDGKNLSAAELPLITGTTVPDNPIVASNASGALTFRFTSDNINNRDGWAATLSCVQPSGVPQSMSDQVRVYPNPFSTQLTLEGVAEIHRVEVMNLIGQQVMQIENNGEQILILSTDNLQPGVYLIRLTGVDDLQSIVKVVKQ